MWLLLIIMIILLTQVSLREKFTCNSNPFFVEKIFRPLSIHNSDNELTKNSSNDYNFLTTKNSIEKLIKKILIKKSKHKFEEIIPNKYSYYRHGYVGYKYNEKKIKKTILKLYKIIKQIFEENIKLNFPKLCNKNVICKLLLLDMRVISLGLHENELSINGQLLLKFNSSSYTFIINYLISEINNTINIYQIILTDIGLQSSQDAENYTNNLYLLSSPEYGIYDAAETYLYSSYESDQFKNQDNLDYIKTNTDIEHNKNSVNSRDYKCYGFDSVDKYNCENIYDVSGEKKKKVGVWDKPCTSNKECPFYKKNTNYKNNFGGCKDGFCEFPLGTTRISPKKYLLDNKMKCHNCRNITPNSTSCCNEQYDKMKYPDLTSPDFIFEGDNEYRNIIK